MTFDRLDGSVGIAVAEMTGFKGKVRYGLTYPKPDPLYKSHVPFDDPKTRLP